MLSPTVQALCVEFLLDPYSYMVYSMTAERLPGNPRAGPNRTQNGSPCICAVKVCKLEVAGSGLTCWKRLPVSSCLYAAPPIRVCKGDDQFLSMLGLVFHFDHVNLRP